jgi:three-Cys-motif partner protein
MSDPIEKEAREWGAWSIWKTKVLLGGYLPLFTKAGSGRAGHMTFIDCFAGSHRNIDRTTKEPVPSSIELALEASPPFTHVLGFELRDRAVALETKLASQHPDRPVRIVGGDCNSKIDEGLAWWRDQGSADGRRGPLLGPALAYLDPDSMELDWATVERISSFGMTPVRPGDFVRRRRAELLILFPTGPMRRTLPQSGPDATEASKNDVDRVFGSEDWRQIYADQRDDKVRGERSWIHYVELYRYQLEQLGYSHTSAIEVRNTRNVVLYHMVFATEHDAGKNIMKSIQQRARKVLPEMIAREKALRAQRGPSLFEGSDAELDRFSANPERYAQLFNDPTSPYKAASGDRPVQDSLFD